MSSSKVVVATHFKDGLVELVEENIEFNNETMLDNLREAAKVTRHQLATRRGNWIGWEPKGKDRMFHRKGWKVYRENWYRVRNADKVPGVRSAVIASKIEPSLTHLLEFGHEIKFSKHGESHGRTQAFNYMDDAFKAGKEYLLGAKVDNP